MTDRFLPGLRAGLMLATALAVGVTVPACDNGPELAQTLELSAPTLNLLVGQSMQITATVKGKGGKTLTGRLVAFQSSAPAVAGVNPDGLVLGLSAGSAIITGVADGVTQSLSVVVTPVPVSRVAMSRDTATIAAATTLQLTANPVDSAGHSLTDRPVTWSTSDATIATVSTTGLVSALAAGTVTISAAAGGKTGQTRITVTPAAVATIDITPSLVTVAEQRTVQLAATLKDAGGHVLTGRTVTWSSSDTAVVKVSSTGLVTAMSVGVANVFARSGGAQGSAGVLVTAVTVGSVKISPDTTTVAKDSTITLTATVKDAAGVALPFKKVSWSSLNPTLASVDSTGKVKGLAAGVALIMAVSDLKADTAVVTVTGAPVSAITIIPAPAVLGLGRSARLNAVLRDANGVITTGTVVWETNDSTRVAIDSTGLLTGVGEGPARVFAVAGGRVAAVNLDVNVVTVNSLSVTPFNVDVPLGSTTAVTAVPYDASSNPLSYRILQFSSSDPTVATVDPTGIVTPKKSGTTTILVVCEGITGTSIITVP